MSERDAIFPAGRQDLYEKNRYSAAIRTGDLLFVSGQVGSREDGSPEPDFARQVRLAFANLEGVLRAAGCSLDDIVDVTSFHTRPDEQMSMVLAAKDAAFPKRPYPNWTAVGVNWLAGFDFEIKAVARIPRQNVVRHNPETLWDMASAGFSQISMAEPGRIALLSGQIAAAPDSPDMPGDLGGQAKQVTANLASALVALEASPHDIVMLRVYVVDATTQAFGQVLEALRMLLGEAMPSITTLGVQALYAPDIKVEIEMTVRVP